MRIAVRAALVAAARRDGLGALDDQVAARSAVFRRTGANVAGGPSGQEELAKALGRAFVDGAETAARRLQSALTALGAGYPGGRKIAAGLAVRCLFWSRHVRFLPIQVSLHGVQRQAIAFRIPEVGDEAIRPDGVLGKSTWPPAASTRLRQSSMSSGDAK